MWLLCGRRAHFNFPSRGNFSQLLRSALGEIPIKLHKANIPKTALCSFLSGFSAGCRRCICFLTLPGVRNVSTTSLREPYERTFVLLVHEPWLTRSRCQWATATDEQSPLLTLSHTHETPFSKYKPFRATRLKSCEGESQRPRGHWTNPHQ